MDTIMTRLLNLNLFETYPALLLYGLFITRMALCTLSTSRIICHEYCAYLEPHVEKNLLFATHGSYGGL